MLGSKAAASVAVDDGDSCGAGVVVKAVLVCVDVVDDAAAADVVVEVVVMAESASPIDVAKDETGGGLDDAAMIADVVIRFPVLVNGPTRLLGATCAVGDGGRDVRSSRGTMAPRLVDSGSTGGEAAIVGDALFTQVVRARTEWKSDGSIFCDARDFHLLTRQECNFRHYPCPER